MKIGDVHIHINDGQQSSNNAQPVRAAATPSNGGVQKKRMPGPRVVRLAKASTPTPVSSRVAPSTTKTQPIPVVPSASIAARTTPTSRSIPSSLSRPTAKPRKKKKRGFLKKAGRFIKKATVASLSPTATTAFVAKKAISSRKKKGSSTTSNANRPASQMASLPVAKPQKKKKRGFLKRAGGFIKKATVASLSPTATTAFAAKKIANSRKRKR